MQLQIQKRLVGGGVVRAHLFPSGESVSKLLGGWAGCSQRFPSRRFCGLPLPPSMYQEPD